MEKKREEAREKRRTKMTRLYHTLCRTLGIGEEERQAMLSGYGATSSVELSDEELGDLCNRLGGMLPERGKEEELDRLRKRLMASIGAWLRMTGREESIELIKGIACRAARVKSFNKIPKERLRNLTWAFNEKRRDTEAVRKLMLPEGWDVYLN